VILPGAKMPNLFGQSSYVFSKRYHMTKYNLLKNINFPDIIT